MGGYLYFDSLTFSVILSPMKSSCFVVVGEGRKVNFHGAKCFVPCGVCPNFCPVEFLPWLSFWMKLYEQNQPKGSNYLSKDVTLTEQQRPKSPTVTIIWHASKYNVHELHQVRDIINSQQQQFWNAAAPGASCLSDSGTKLMYSHYL